MGIIDDYYGGYENLAMHTDLDGDVDFDGAYGSACDFHSDNDSDAAVFGGNTRNSKLGATATSKVRPATNQQIVPDAKRKRANTKKTGSGSGAAPKAAPGNKENVTASSKVAVKTAQAQANHKDKHSVKTAKAQANHNDKTPAQKQT